MSMGLESIARLFTEEMTDEEIKQFAVSHALHPSPGVSAAGLTALSLRSTKKLEQAIEKFNKSSDRYSRWMFALTVALFFLAVLQTIILIKH